MTRSALAISSLDRVVTDNGAKRKLRVIEARDLAAHSTKRVDVAG